MQWIVISFSVMIIFSFAMVVKSADDNDFGFAQLIRFFWNVGTKVSPLLGPRPLLLQDDQDFFEFVFIQGTPERRPNASRRVLSGESDSSLGDVAWQATSSSPRRCSTPCLSASSPPA